MEDTEANSVEPESLRRACLHRVGNPSLGRRRDGTAPNEIDARSVVARLEAHADRPVLRRPHVKPVDNRRDGTPIDITNTDVDPVHDFPAIDPDVAQINAAEVERDGPSTEGEG